MCLATKRFRGPGDHKVHVAAARVGRPASLQVLIWCAFGHASQVCNLIKRLINICKLIMIQVAVPATLAVLLVNCRRSIFIIRMLCSIIDVD